MSERNTHIKYPFAPLDEGAFFFPTDSGCYYTIEILEAGYKLWSSDRLSTDDKVFELSFDRKCDESDVPYDECVGNTIIHIFGSNMASKGDTCVYYHICDNDRGGAKPRLYDWWYEDLQKLAPEFEMKDFEMIDNETGEKYFASLFIHQNHPDKELIISEFEKAISNNF